MNYDIVIMGGGIMGSAAAYFLARSGLAGAVAVIEPDPSYKEATTPQGAGGVRQQFSLPENIAMSSYSLDFYKRFESKLADIPDVQSISFREQGYLFVVGKDGEETLRKNVDLQSSMGVTIQLMDKAETARKFPSIDRQDIALTCYTPDDGWIDPYAALQGFRRAAEHMGVTYICSSVTDMQCSGTEVHSVALADGSTINGKYFINTAGPWANKLAEMTGASLPVVPMCRVQHFWKCAHELEPLPLVKDESGMFFRPEGDGFAGGRPSFDIAPGFIDDIYSGFFANYFEEVIWPMMASLVPKFEAIKLQRSWAGHYAQNLLDGNMIIGKYSPGHENLITACGFSGHGIMHAPAVGRALAELALNGSYQTLDLTRMEMSRVHKNEPYAEVGIK
ncbi:4-methylaminobutanoate oxidase (formaldehyde-forming) [Pseudovibrio sp. Ad13]|uniref:NAD(P)/FAD-dependent oxidoreductase n=1 Tax=Pseudovibrio sp. Ad13 TaxID=989396 RepID=UPI0007AE9CCB|nr:FAD-binding oxidoreductase [Pseudovibrio sp. Ad13]KZK84521.1 4-methylaminobutanoate oxidase (formaldehyde-forming) [Pseudovibrio sp. Ad13]